MIVLALAFEALLINGYKSQGMYSEQIIRVYKGVSIASDNVSNTKISKDY
jgi:hypothetical protein